jgi:hypothetical protein
MVAVVEELILLPLLVKTAALVVAVLVNQGLLVVLETHLLQVRLKEVMVVLVWQAAVAAVAVVVVLLLLEQQRLAQLAVLVVLVQHLLYQGHQ